MINRFLRSAAWLLLLPLQAVNASPACPTINMAPATTLSSGTAGVSYGPATFTASGSLATPFTYEITSGLPSGSGLSINSSSGDLSGTPLQAGSFIMTVTAADTNGCTGGRSYALDIAVGNQTINFTSTAPSAATVGGTTYNVTATATSGLPVTFTIDAAAASICSIAGSTVSFTAVGTCVIDANQAGNASFNAASQVQQSFAVGMGAQNITFTSTPPSSPTVNGPTYTVTATGGGSGNPVTFTIDATATSVCSISGSTVSFTAVGTCVIDANQAGNANYNAAPQAIQSFAVGKGNQTITLTSTVPASATVGGATYTPTATATSGLPVTFTIDATAASICSISGGIVSFIAVGTCVVDANQAGDTNWNAAPQAQQSFAVGKGSQTISFTSTTPAAATVGGATYNVTATATSGLPVGFTIDASATSICSISGSTVSFTAVGTCVIDANQAGNANYTAAPQVQQTFGVGQGSQTITFTSTAPSGATVGGSTYNVTATATSGLPVTLTIDSGAASVCSLSGSTVSFIGTGTCLIDANQAGNTNYTAAPQVQQSFGVGQGSQAIAFTSTPPAAKVGGSTYNVTANGGASGNPVVFTIDASASSICSIAGGTVSFTAVGTCVIDANQAGNANYLPAPQAQQSFGVVMGDQTITFTSTAPAATVGGSTYNVTATATSGLTVTFSIDATATSVCSISSGNVVSFIAVGTCVIDADQAGDTNWNPAPQAQQSFAVGQGSQTISFTSTAPTNAKVGGSTYTVTATATSGLPVTFSLDATSTGCSIAGNVVSFTAVGTCKIDANQGGNANYTAAPQAQQSFAVAKGDQTITFTSTAPSNAQVNGSTYNVTATASSGLAVTLTIDATATSICSISGSTVSFNAGGTCVIDANQSGNGNYNAATQAQQSFFVAKLDQTITFTSTAPAGAKVGGSNYTVTATASSGLAVTFSAGSTACNVAGSTVSFVHAATCTVNADQAGNAQYNAAPQAQQSFAVAKGDQTISFSTTAPTFGSASASASPHTYAAAATATSGLAVIFTTSGACSNASNLVTYGPGAGSCTINADQAGNADWNSAPQVQQSTTVEIPVSATNDTHAVTGNVAIAAGTSVTSNDSGTAIAIKSYGASTGGEQTTIGNATPTAQGGSVTLVAAGTYNYDPPANFTGTDTFKYVIGNDLAATSTGTVTLTVSDRIMVVATSGVGTADCKPQSACTLATADGKAAVTSGKDLVFVESGSYNSASFSLLASQNIVGQKVALSPTALADAGITLASESVSAPITALAASTTPALSNSNSVITLGGGNLIEYFSITNTAGSAILGNAAGSGTSSIHDITVTDAANAGNGVNLTANVGTLNFSNLVVTTSSGNAFAATGGGTINATQDNVTTINTLVSTSGTALNVANTTIGASGLTFRSISSGSAAGTAPNGIMLNTTGASGGVTVTGNGSAGSGGTIQHKTGADGSATQGSGIFLNSTQQPSFSWMQLNDFQNYGIVGTNVTGLTLNHIVINGTNGTSASGIGEGDVYFTGLSGSVAAPVSVSNSTFIGAFTDAFHVFNDSAQTLNRITITGSTFATVNGAGNTSNDALVFEATGGTMNVTVQSSSITSARGDLFQLNLLGTVTSDLVFGGAGVGNALSNNNANIVSGGGGVTIGGGGATNNITLTYNISHNTFSGAHGAVLAISKGTGVGASFTGTIDSNVIGTQGSFGSGSTQGEGIAVFQDGAGLSTTTITNNHVSGVVAGRGAIDVYVHNGASGKMVATVQGNTIDTLDQTNSFAGMYLQTGSNTVSSGSPDNNRACLTIGGSTAALKNAIDIGPNTAGNLAFGITVEQEGTSQVGLLGTPNYSGGAYNATQIQNYVAANNTFTVPNGSPVGELNDSAQPAGDGFLGTCP